MTFRKVFIATILAPLVLLFLIWAFYRFFTPDDFQGKFKSTESDLVFKGEDGSSLYGTTESPTGVNQAPLVYLIPDRQLDRDWNSTALSFQTGGRISHYLAAAGRRVVRYDQRGSGASSKAARDISAVSLLAEDLVTLSRKTRGDATSVTLLAQGQGCLVALYAVNRLKLKANRLILTSCAFSGTLLETWGRRILKNLRFAKAKPEVIQQAEKELELWLKEEAWRKKPAKKKDDKKDKTPPNLAAFRTALEYFSRPMMQGWTKEAAVLRFEDELNIALGKGNLRIDHLLGEFDREFSPVELKYTKDVAGRLSGKHKTYSFAVLPKTNHFLKHQDEATTGGMDMTWKRISPFANVSQELLKRVLAE